MAKTLRVHHLAKELGIASKEIIAKCNAEGVEPAMKNHMAAVSLGLAESIREWFSAGDDVTTIEVASRVDLSKVRKPRKREAEEEQSADDAGGVAVAEPEAPADSTATIQQSPVIAAESVATVVDVVPASAEQPAVETTEVAEKAASAELAAAISDADVTGSTAEGAAETTEGQDSSRSLETAGQEPAAPKEPPPAPEESPAPIMPAGPQLVPKPAELSGPRVIRIEAPEPVRAPRPRPRPGVSRPGPSRPGAPRPAAFHPAARSGLPPRPGEKVWDRPHGGRKKGAAGRDSGPAHSRSPRRRSNAEVSSERLKEWKNQDLIDRKERLASATGHGVKARRSAERNRRSGGRVTAHTRQSEITITTPAPLKEFCAAVGVPFGVVFGRLIEHTGRPYKITDMLDAEAAELVALDLGVTLKIKRALSALEKLEAEVEQRERDNLQPRPPVVAMLGHVDHGKTSLLDVIRRTHVVDGEAGGITQHIGAYQVTKGDWNVTFLDTPGHEAFTAMRARGANLTDVVVLVVAVDDGVMPQTIEAINHAKAAGVQVVVALNKCDLPGCDLNKIYAQLAEHELIPAEWGGETDVFKTSATTGEGIEDLVAHLSMLSELLDLKADPTIPAVGVVIEAQMREGRGVAAQVLVREGTLAIGQSVVCGPGAGRVRTLLDHRGKRVKSAGPGSPIEVVGLDALPRAGEKLYVVGSLPEAKRIAEEIKIARREEELNAIRKPQTLEDLLSSAGEGEVPELNVIVKADVQGSVDVLKAFLGQFPSDKARLNILHAGVGVVSEADIELARASNAMLIGFHVVADDRARRLAEQAGVELRLYRIIYEVRDDLHKALEGLLEPEHHEEARGRVEVREVFSVTRVGRIAGCYVAEGVVARNHRTRLLRDGRIVAEGQPIGSLRRFKDDAREVRAGLECGLKIEGYNDLKPGDVIEVYEVVEVAQTL